MVKRVPLAFALIAILVALDQWSKHLVETMLPYRISVEFIPFFAFFRTYNDGVAFSLLSGFGVGGLVVIGVIVFVLVLWLWSKVEPGRWLTHLGFALIAAGALGNLIDRATLGYVIDFIQFHTANWSFAIFNVADAYISVGVGAIIVDEFLAWKNQKTSGSE
jgi:signal peptidase II